MQFKEHDQGSQGTGVETDPKIVTVDLRGKVPGGASIEFLRAETLNEPHSPFAVVFCTLEGRDVEMGLRIDLHKGVFLDHFDDDPPKEAVCRRAAQEITAYIASTRPRLV